jgi:hypothetical protein
MVRRSQSSDLPRPATPDDEPSELVAIEKLANARVEDGWVRAGRPRSSEFERFWNPLEEYHQGRQPYLPLIQCADSEAAIAAFLKKYGTIVGDQQATTLSEVAFRLEEFRRERWVFALTTFLAGTLKKPDSFEKSQSLRRIFQERLEHAAQNVALSGEGVGQWQHIMEDIRWAFGSNEPSEPTNSPKEYAQALVRLLKERLRNTSGQELAKAARSYLTRVIGTRVRQQMGPNLNFGFDTDGRATVHIHSENLLDLFYWMLAQDIRDRRTPVHCAYCGRVFLSNKRNEIYCPDRPRCKERGRRRLDWERNKDRYNKNRKLKRHRERERTKQARRKSQ